MPDRMTNQVKLSQQSWAALNRNSHLLLFPTLAASVMIGIAIVLVVLVANSPSLQPLLPNQPPTLEVTHWLLALAIATIYYVISHAIVIFSNTALVGTILKLLQHKPVTLDQGLRLISKRSGPILSYALLSATVGTIAHLTNLFNRGPENAISASLGGLLGGLNLNLWDVTVFFVLPLLIAEQLGVVASLKQSLTLFRQTWAGDFIGATTIDEASSMVYITIWLIGGALMVSALQSSSLATLIAALLFTIAAFRMVHLINGSVNGVLQASLYNYAVTGDAGRFIKTHLATTAFQK